MIVALSVVACVLVVVGLGSIAQGMPIVRLEAGWTMVIAGTVATTGGLVLAGVAVVVSGLRRVERALVRERFPPIAFPPTAMPPVPAPVNPMPVVPMPPVPAQPSAPLPAVEPPAPRFEAAAVEADAKAGEPPEESAESRAILAADALLPASADAPLSPTAALLPAEEPAAPPAPSEDANTDAPPAEPPEPAIVGTYASGGNRYVMYADGTIRADTPRGEFRFGSLDELKAFVAAGGEEGSADEGPRPA